MRKEGYIYSLRPGEDALFIGVPYGVGKILLTEGLMLGLISSECAKYVSSGATAR